MVIEINGMAHVILTVSSFEVAREFYRRLLPEFGMKVMFDGDRFFYCVGARTAIGIEPCDPELAGERFVQQRVGLHHFCLRARSREDVDKCAALLSEDGRNDRSRPSRRRRGAGLLLRVVRGPGRHQARGQLCSGRRPARGGGAVSPRPAEYGLKLRRPIRRPRRRQGIS
jgi:catechol 2,3-dioxygenase-like lactoylglutathione lyase family enzyme